MMHQSRRLQFRIIHAAVERPSRVARVKEDGRVEYRDTFSSSGAVHYIQSPVITTPSSFASAQQLVQPETAGARHFSDWEAGVPNRPSESGSRDLRIF
mmetsp:Transcript_17021/g.49172  ORF Transcript_17021/g.49172 Transcript_17021/m.49172 type:complete len:98 (+) Transcript_17021:220-513(+)